MANGSCVLAHLLKLVVSLICMRYLESSIFAIESLSPARICFQILLVHSVLGVLTFGTSGNIAGKRLLRNFYDKFTNHMDTLPFGLLATEISLRCYVNETLRLGLLLVLVILPFAHEFTRKKDRSTMRHLTDVAVIVQLFTVVSACLRRGQSAVLSFAVSYAINRYFLENMCDRFDVPHIDIVQYGICFVEIFGLVAINEL